MWKTGLIILSVKRVIVTNFKQTVLGTVWYFIQPLFTSNMDNI